MFKKNKGNLNDMVIVSLQSGDNDDPGMGDQFQKGNVLRQSEKDEPPPSNMYSTENVGDHKTNISINSFPFSKDSFLKDRIGKNKLINDDDNIEYLESEGNDSEVMRGQLLDFNNDISPSHFDQPNLRIESDIVSNIPIKPQVQTKRIHDNNEEMLEIEDLQDI